MQKQDTVMSEDWKVIESLLPEGWKEKARELGAVQRFRGFSNVGDLLRTLLIHVAEGASLRETAVRAKEGRLANVTDVAILKRLRKASGWMRWMAEGVMRTWLKPEETQLPDGVSRVRIMDGSSIQRPGAKGTTWRVHYSMELPTMLCDEVHVTGAETGESLKLFTIEPGDLILGDRGLAHRRGIHHVVSHGGDVLVRVGLRSIPFHDEQGGRIDVLGCLRGIQHHAVWDKEVVIKYGDFEIFGRICAVRKTKEATKKAQKRILRENRKKGRKTKPETLEAAAYTMVFTTLDRSIPAETVLNLYRARWQVELVFKRLKSILGIGSLHKTDPESAKAWLHTKLLVAFLIEALKVTAERFSPWGFPIEAEETQHKITLAGNTPAAAFSPPGGEPDQLAPLTTQRLERLGK